MLGYRVVRDLARPHRRKDPRASQSANGDAVSYHLRIGILRGIRPSPDRWHLHDDRRPGPGRPADDRHSRIGGAIPIGATPCPTMPLRPCQCVEREVLSRSEEPDANPAGLHLALFRSGGGPARRRMRRRWGDRAGRNLPRDPPSADPGGGRRILARLSDWPLRHVRRRPNKKLTPIG